MNFFEGTPTIWVMTIASLNRAMSYLVGIWCRRFLQGSERCLLSSCQTEVSIKHYNDVIMSAMASQITSLTIVCSTVYSGANQRKHQSSASLAFVRGIHRSPVNSPHKGPVTRKMFPFDGVIMTPWWYSWLVNVFALLTLCVCVGGGGGSTGQRWIPLTKGR